MLGEGLGGQRSVHDRRRGLTGAEMRQHVRGTLDGSVQDDDLARTLRHRRRSDGLGRAACPEQHHRMGRLLAQGIEEAASVGVVTQQEIALLDDDVHGARPLGGFRHAVELWNHASVLWGR